MSCHRSIIATAGLGLLLACSPSPATTDAGAVPDAAVPPDASGLDTGTAPPTDGGMGSDAGDVVGASLAARTAYVGHATSIDLDGNGVAEWTLVWGAGDSPTHEEIDSNGDGMADLVWDRTDTSATHTADRNFDGTFEYTLSGTRASAATTDPVTYVVTEDTTDDFVPDFRTTFTVDPSSTSYDLAFESDAAQTGTWSDAGSTTVDLDQPRVPVHFPGSTDPGQCTPDQQMQLQNALDAAIANGTSCLFFADPSLANEFLRTAATANLSFDCGGSSANCGLSTTLGHTGGWLSSLFGGADVHIQFSLSTFSTSQCGDSIESTVFHELMHYAIGPHNYGDGTQDPGDRVYGCEHMCYGSSGGSGNGRDCAQCLGARNGTNRCNHFPPAMCPSSPPGFCTCRSRYMAYPTLTQCTVECPSGLSCFASACVDNRGPCRP
jgi:hypothetical protein